MQGNKPSLSGFGIGYLPSASGNRISMPAVDLKGSAMNSYQTLKNTVSLHGMTYVTSSANTLLNNGQLNNQYLKHVSY